MYVWFRSVYRYIHIHIILMMFMSKNILRLTHIARTPTTEIHLTFFSCLDLVFIERCQ